MADIIIGFHPIEEALKSSGPSSLLYVDRKPTKRNLLLVQAAEARRVAVKRITAPELDSMSGRGVSHKGALLVYVPSVEQKQIKDVKGYLAALGDTREAVVLFLDGITDPQNLGAILRSADLFQVDLVVVPERRSVHQNSTVMKVSSGAEKYVPLVVVKNLVREMQLLQKEGFWFYGADMGGTPVQGVPMKGRVGLVMGAEGDGLSRLIREKCDRLVSIPVSGHIDSLNVSVAAGILLYEVRRGASAEKP
ncbi:MAG: 23S rRNA (guanosine(2251)-2'-O)-methyltransferase RlmB [Spirochaetales bacterium]|jgi:23S rRNA (guanosine2251-2'-O)-methyltransferase|nr:23S rRNA (guanosine(2251)-2'-O)-methyltransferase RlmB [Spirochaetales bacterium]